MYFWKIESLKKDIVNGSFSDRELIPYVVVCAGLYALAAELTAYLPYESVNGWTYTLSMQNVLIPIFGTIYVYQSNGGSNGSDFAAKYFAIGFVVGIRFLVYLIPVMMLLAAYWIAVFGGQDELPTTYVEVFLFLIWYALFYFRMAKYVGDTAKA